MPEPEAHKRLSQGMTQERDRGDVLAARPLPPDGDDLTEDEDRLFLAGVLDA